MQNEFIRSLQMIKILGIKNQTQYKELSRDFLILSLDSLKYISQKNDFREIVKMANEICLSPNEYPRLKSKKK